MKLLKPTELGKEPKKLRCPLGGVLECEMCEDDDCIQHEGNIDPNDIATCSRCINNPEECDVCDDWSNFKPFNIKKEFGNAIKTHRCPLGRVYKCELCKNEECIQHKGDIDPNDIASCERCINNPTRCYLCDDWSEFVAGSQGIWEACGYVRIDCKGCEHEQQCFMEAREARADQDRQYKMDDPDYKAWEIEND